MDGSALYALADFGEGAAHLCDRRLLLAMRVLGLHHTGLLVLNKRTIYQSVIENDPARSLPLLPPVEPRQLPLETGVVEASDAFVLVSGLELCWMVLSCPASRGRAARGRCAPRTSCP